MKTKLINLVLLAGLVIAARAQTAAPVSGGGAAPPSAQPQSSEADLEKLVAPIALYPDPLLATLLPASAYPLDIVKAARFIANTNNIPKIDSQPWDSNVKALARFPDVIQKMNDDLDWTSSLGEAFANDQKSVMNAIQVMRDKAQEAGSLKTTPQQTVTVTNTVVQQTVNQQVVVVTNTVVQIVPTSPGVIYVPTYNPTIVYGTPVVYGAPTPGAVAAASVISFGVGMTMGAIMANNCNWHSGGVYVGPRGGVAWSGGYHGDVEVNRDVNRTVNRNVNRENVNNVNRNNFNNNNVNRNNVNNNNFNNYNGNRNTRQSTTANTGGQQKWQADPSRRETASGASPASRGWGGGNYSGQRDAFDNSGGASQAQSASQRGTTSRSGGQFNGAGQSSGGAQRSGGFQRSGGAQRSGGGFRGRR